MNEEQAFQVVSEALNVATTKGTFDLNNVGLILQALSVLKPKEEQFKEV
jgi:hypothetical protein